MFVLELSKPSGICLAALRRRGRCVGYLICSRYDTVWHLMNVAVDPDRRRRGHRDRAARRALFERVGDDAAQFTLEVRPLQRRRDRALRALRLPLRRHAAAATTRTTARTPLIMWRTPATLRRPLDDVPTRAPARVILALETSCDDTCAAVVDARRRDPLERRSPRRACTTATAASCRRSPRATTSSWSTRSSTTRSRRPATTLDDVEPVAVTQGPGLVGALLVGVATAKALAAARAAAARRRSTTCRATSPPTSSQPEPFEPPFLCLIACGGHTLLARVDDHARLRACSGRRSTTPPARRSTRARACSASATRAARRCRGLARGRRPGGVRVPDARARVAGLDFSLRRPQDRAALHGARPGRGGDARARAPTSPPPTSTRSSRR